MQVINTAKDLSHILAQKRTLGASIGFVPTMGALHEGHLALVERARKENEVVVVSIFVNPTQFNDQGDLARYPRTLEADLEKLASLCDIAYAPSVADVYPTPDARQFDFGSLDLVMEGKHRPGHFNGVAQVVSRLFDIVEPGKAYFGEKDFQQLAIIKYMVAALGYKVQIVPCPIVREADGLAMSSRNTLLSAEQRAQVPVIARTLFAVADKVCDSTLDELKAWAVQQIEASPVLKVEYLEIVDTKTLQPVHSLDDEGGKQACVAVQVGKVRLIDNVRIG